MTGTIEKLEHHRLKIGDIGKSAINDMKNEKINY
jgi:hypothetical protein